MTSSNGALPPQVLDVLQRGQTIEAIKLLREATGLGLKEAKDLVDAHRRGESLSAVPSAVPPDRSTGSLPAPVLDALGRGNKIEAIRLMREHTGLGLKEAKDAVDAAEARTAPGALSPGEMPRSGRGWWWLAAACVGAVVIYGLRTAG